VGRSGFGDGGTLAVAGRLEVTVEHLERPDAIHPEPPFGLGQMAPRAQVPLAFGREDRVRVDDATGPLVPPVDVVVDLDLFGLLGGPPERVEEPPRAELHRHPLRSAEHPGELRQRGPEGPAGVGAGNGEERPPRGQQLEALRRREAERPGEVLGETQVHGAVDDLAVDEAVRAVRREPTERDQLEVAFELGDLHPEAGGDVLQRRALVVEDPGDHGEEAAEPGGGVGAAHDAVSLDAVSLDVAGCPNDARNDVISSRSPGGASTSAWSRSPTT